MRTFLLCWFSLGIGAAGLQAEELSAGRQLLALVFERQDSAGKAYPHMADPPLWPQSKFLLEGESNRQLHTLLDQLLAAKERDLPPPRERALVQNLLWQLFAWTTVNLADQQAERAALRPKLARAIRHLALTKEDVAALPDNLASDTTSALPPLLARDSTWVALGLNAENPLAEAHLERLNGSIFTVFLRHPQGRAAALNLLKELAKVPFPLQRNDLGNTFFTHDAIPVKLPEGTEVALLRRMLLLDREGRAVESPITQTLQQRTMIRFTADEKTPHQPADTRMQEFQLDRASYIRGDKMSLAALKAKDVEPLVFLSHGVDPYEETSHRVQYPVVLEHCAACHRDSGTASLNSFTRLFSGIAKENPGLRETSLAREAAVSFQALSIKPAWKELQKHWPLP